MSKYNSEIEHSFPIQTTINKRERGKPKESIENKNHFSLSVNAWLEIVNAKGLIITDDVYFAVPEEERSELKMLSNYERSIFMSARLAAELRDVKIMLFVQAPPFEFEFSRIKQFFGKLTNLEIIYKQTNIWGLYLHSPLKYKQLVKNYEYQGDDPNYFFRLIAEKLINDIDDQVLYYPFQTTDSHYGFGEFTSDKLKLLSNGNNDKSEVISWLTAETETAKYTPKGKDLLFEKDVEDFARRILDFVLEFEERNQLAYIKLNSAGVSGLGNIPWTYEYVQTIYNRELGYNLRLEYLKNLILKRGLKKGTKARVEQKIEADKTWFGKKHYVVSVDIVNGEILIKLIIPNLTDEHDEYFGTIYSRIEEKIVSKEDHDNIKKAISSIGKVIVKHGYVNGPLSIDVMIDNDQVYAHDFNFRRGGRTHLESFLPGLVKDDSLYLDAETIIKIPYRFTDNDDLISYLRQNGLEIYSSSYFHNLSPSKREIKIKAIVNMSLITDSFEYQEAGDIRRVFHKYLKRVLKE